MVIIRLISGEVYETKLIGDADNSNSQLLPLEFSILPATFLNYKFD